MGIMYRCSLGGGGETCEFIAPNYDANKTDYAADDVVLKDGKVMKYNGSEWEDFSLAECTTLNSNLGGKVTLILSNESDNGDAASLTELSSNHNFKTISFDTIDLNGHTSEYNALYIIINDARSKFEVGQSYDIEGKKVVIRAFYTCRYTITLS